VAALALVDLLSVLTAGDFEFLRERLRVLGRELFCVVLWKAVVGSSLD
jgi:hypothetical protein